MNKEENQLESIFPKIIEARACFNQQNYSLSAEIYADLLSESTNSGKYTDEDPLLCRIYIEYSDALINSSAAYFTLEMSNLLSNIPFNVPEREQAEDDLETAWNLLELSKIVFTKNKDVDLLKKNFYLLGEICMLNNQFEEAIVEYSNSYALETVQNPNVCQCLHKIANCFEFLKKYEDSIKFYSKLIAIYETSKEELSLPIDDYIVELKDKIKQLKESSLANNDIKESLLDEKEDPMKNEEEDTVIIDLNMYKKKSRKQ